MRLRAFPEDLDPVATDACARPIWEAAARGEVAVPQCGCCGHKWMQPSPFCPTCQSADVHYAVLSGRGTLYSFTVLAHPAGDGAGYAPAIVELDDAPGVRLISNVVEADSAELTIGMPLVAEFVPLSNDMAFTVFRPVRL